jgi:16S rRNA (adenine1518-N6/adenine1519-N6)-dimethyltransferase
MDLYGGPFNCHASPMDTLRDRVNAYLKTNGIKLDHSLGQNFLVNEDVLETIVESADISPEDQIVEIGPGIGVLTQYLLEQAKHVTVIELDRRFEPILKKFTKHVENAEQKLTFIQGNALAVALPTEPYKIVANIPYHITSPLLRHAFLESPVAPTSLTLLIQKEVAEKICDTKHAGLLTITVALFGTPTLITKVHKESFIPPPEVESAVLHIECFPKPLADAKTIDAVLRLAKVGFGQKRKMLRNSFGSLPGGLELLEKAGIEATRRPETLTIQEWIALAQ